ncbi:hypothetical protein PBI_KEZIACHARLES14_79 [Mycobacterium phage Keziacharles14]|nr:hypothetical protein PBI_KEZIACHARLES14_79 [Mycobacterium phage Keziacharles14]
MSLKAKCKHKHCTWKVRAEGSVFLHLSYQAHMQATGHHKFKIKGS